MTSPDPPEEDEYEEPPFPSSRLEALGSDGAFVIGGNTLASQENDPEDEDPENYKFGQLYNEDLIREMFKLPAPTLENAIEILRENLLKLPLKVLLMFKELLPDEVEGLWDTVENAVDTIIDALDNVPAFFKWLTWWLCIDMLIENITDHVGDLLTVNWLDPSSIWTAVLSSWDFWKGVGNWLLAVVARVTGLEMLEQSDFLKELVSLLALGVFQTAWNNFADTWGDINWLSLGAIWEAICAVGNLIKDLFHWLMLVIKNLTTIDLENIAESLGITGLANALTTWASTLLGINWANPITAIRNVIGAFVKLSQDLGNWVLDMIEQWLGWNTDVIKGMFTDFNTFVMKIVDFFFGESGLSGWVRTLEALAGEVGATITAAIKGLYEAVKKMAQMIGESVFISDIVQFFEDIFGPQGLLGWLSDVRKQITEAKLPTLDLDKIKEQVEQLLGGTPVSQINSGTVNMLSQGNFNSSDTVTPGDGWSWDGSLTATGTGGSAKCEASGSMQRLFSRQSLKVVEGDRVTVTAKVRTDSFTAASGRSMVLAIIPWKYVSNVMTAQTPVVLHTRTTASAGTWANMAGSTYTVPTDVVRLTVRLGVTANSGAIVWFDDVHATKTGKLEQGLVANLVETWQQTWQSVFGGSGSGKLWSDFVTAITHINIGVGDAQDDADAAAGTGLGIIDAIGKAVFGEATYNTLPGQVKTSLQHFINKLFGVNTVQTQIQPAAVPELDASVITSGVIDIEQIPTSDVGATINPGAGSGAMLIRSASEPVAPRTQNARALAPDGFFTSLQVSSSDIDCLTTSGGVGTGTRGDYAGAFRVDNAGWYMVELATRINIGFGNGAFSCAPVLYKGSSLGGTSAYKIGTDCHTIVTSLVPLVQVQHRFVQTSWIVYLNANEIVRAGFDTSYSGAATSGLGGQSGTGTSGVETYFSISLLNKSFA